MLGYVAFTTVAKICSAQLPIKKNINTLIKSIDFINIEIDSYTCLEYAECY